MATLALVSTPTVSPTLLELTPVISDGSDIVFEKSTNGGSTWSAPAVAVKPLLSGGLTDKDWLWVDSNASSKYKNSLYVSVTQFNASETQTQISVTHSSNGGSTWKTVAVDTLQPAGTIYQFSDITTDKAGNVYATWMRCTATGPTGDCGGAKSLAFLVSESKDGGNTWSTPVTVNTAMLAPDSCGGYYGCVPNTSERLSNIPVIGVDNSTGKHAGDLLCRDYNYTGKYTSTQVTVSTNHGSTWGTPVAVAPTSDTHDQFFGWLSVSNTGQVGVTWLDRRNDSSNISYEELARSQAASTASQNTICSSRQSYPIRTTTVLAAALWVTTPAMPGPAKNSTLPGWIPAMVPIVRMK